MTRMQQQIRNRVAQKVRPQLRRQTPQVQSQQFQPQVQAQDITISKKDKPGFIGVFLISCIFFMFVGTLLVMVSGEGYFSGIMSQEFHQESVTPISQVTPVQPQAQAQPQPTQPPLDLRVAQMEKDLDVFQHRVWLLALSANENANMAKKMDAQHHKVDNRGFVTLDEKWQLSKMPETMALTPEQREEILNGVK